MEDRRQMRRFTLRLPCMIYTPDHGDGEVYCAANTRNIGIGGVFIEAVPNLAQGMNLRIELLVQKRATLHTTGRGSCLSLCGHVLRLESSGMAMEFEGYYQITRLSEVVGLSRARSRWLQGKQNQMDSNVYDLQAHLASV